MVHFFLGNERNDPFPKNISEKIQTIITLLSPHPSISYNIFFTIFVVVFFKFVFLTKCRRKTSLPFLKLLFVFPYKLQVRCT